MKCQKNVDTIFEALEISEFNYNFCVLDWCAHVFELVDVLFSRTQQYCLWIPVQTVTSLWTVFHPFFSGISLVCFGNKRACV